MKSALKIIGLFLTAALLSRCISPPKTTAPSAQWYGHMHQLSSAHLQLMPLVSDPRSFSDPANRSTIEKNLKDMSEAADAIARDQKAPDADPIIRFSAMHFALQTKQAYKAFKFDDLQWSRYALSRATGYCISCHTRADKGARDFDLAWTPNLQPLNPPQRVEFLLANRRYTTALNEAQALATDVRWPKADPQAWTVAVERAMAMIVRVRKDPVEAVRLAQAVAENRAVPYYIRRDASSWLTDIRQWRAEKPGARTPYQTAIAIMGRVHQAGAFPGRSRLVANLRASGLLHEQLEKPRSPQYAEALLYSGLISQNLNNINQGYLDQFYFESCIREKPHSELAERCFEELDLAVQGASPFLELQPELEMNRLSELRKLAEVEHFDEPVWSRRSWEQDLNDEALKQRKKRSGD